MKYKVECEINIGSDYEVEADSEQEAESIAYDMFVSDYGLKDNSTVLGFGIVNNIEKIEE